MSDATSNGSNPSQGGQSAGASSTQTEPSDASGQSGAPADSASHPGKHEGAQSSGAPSLDLGETLARALAEAAEFRDQYLRAKAEAENIRRRGQEDVAKAHKFAIEGFAESLLPVRDSLELALANTDSSPESLKEGVDATLRLLVSAFERHKLAEINPAGEKFDPNRHQAIAMVPGNTVDPPVQPNHVVAVLQKGYLINDRVLRPAMVSVAQA